MSWPAATALVTGAGRRSCLQPPLAAAAPPAKAPLLAAARTPAPARQWSQQACSGGGRQSCAVPPAPAHIKGRSPACSPICTVVRLTEWAGQRWGGPDRARSGWAARLLLGAPPSGGCSACWWLQTHCYSLQGDLSGVAGPLQAPWWQRPIMPGAVRRPLRQGGVYRAGQLQMAVPEAWLWWKRFGGSVQAAQAVAGQATWCRHNGRAAATCGSAAQPARQRRHGGRLFTSIEDL